MKKWLILALVFLLCGSAMAAQEPQAVSRGGTLVLRIPHEWIDSVKLGACWWNSIFQSTDETAAQVLFQYIAPERAEALAAQGDFSDEIVRTLYISEYANNALQMSVRPLNDGWYAAIRPKEDFDDRWSFLPSISEYRFSCEHGQAGGSAELEYVDEASFSLQIKSMDGMKAAWEKDIDNFRLRLYPVQEVYIAVIHENGTAEEDLKYAQLHIDLPTVYNFGDVFIKLSGYLDGGKGVYCCVLSGEEAEAIMNGGRVYMAHDHIKW